MPEEPSLELLFLIDTALTAHFAAGGKPDWIKGKSCNNDNRDGEIIFDLADGSELTLRSRDLER